jgi:hypothetical protein
LIAALAEHFELTVDALMRPEYNNGRRKPK